jgi:DNA-binding transcriptional regulator YdaS (Cro superfamily)
MTKTAFAALCGVSRPRVSQWIVQRKIDGAALVGVGHRARIDVEIARAQLRQRLDVSQWRAGRARLDGDHVPAGRVEIADAAPTIEAEIKAAHLRRIELANRKAEAEAAVASGEYLPAADVRREVGAIAGGRVATFEGMVPTFADAVASHWGLPQPDVLQLLRATWRAARARQSAFEARTPETGPEAAIGLPGQP